MSSFQQYQAEFTAHIRDPKAAARPAGVPARRMKVYTEIVFNNMEATLSACFPVARKVLGVRRWTRLVRAFFAQHRCATPWFRQIPEEFLRWLEPAPDAASSYLYSLAHYEWVELALTLSDAPVPPHDPDGDLLAGVPLLAPALMLLRYDWPVQRISPHFKPLQPLAEPVHLLVFRDAGDQVRFVEINQVSARLLGQLQAGGISGAAALKVVADDKLLHPEPAAILQYGAALLADLRRQGAIIGVRCD